MEDRPISLLYRAEAKHVPLDSGTVFSDLHLDQVITRVTRERETYALDAFYAQKPTEPGDVLFRLEIMRDVERNLEGFRSFLMQYHQATRCLAFAQVREEASVMQKWQLDGARWYLRAVETLEETLASDGIRAEGFLRFRAWLHAHRRTDAYRAFESGTRAQTERFDRTRLGLVLDLANDRITVEQDLEPDDLGADLRRTFARYGMEGLGEDSAFADIHMSGLELRLLAIHKENHPRLFSELQAYAQSYGHFVDEALAAFERELQFFVSYALYMQTLREAGYPFAYPSFCAEERLDVAEGYDLSLAQLAHVEERTVVPNDVSLRPGERSLILTGPNQGGKTTFARMLGQIVCLASLGLPVPCRKAVLCLPGAVYTHFAVEEDSTTGDGRLREELTRLAPILKGASERGWVLFNELFSSTTQHDARLMGARVLRALSEKGCMCLYVTHIVALAGEPGAVSLVAGIADGTARTFRMERRPADGLVYAGPLLDQYGLRGNSIQEVLHAPIPAV